MYNFVGKMKDSTVVLRPQIGSGGVKRQGTTVGRANDGGGESRGSTSAATGSGSRRMDASSAKITKNQSKMLLRELCVDKDYLEHLTSDPSNFADPAPFSSENTSSLSLSLYSWKRYVQVSFKPRLHW